MIAYYYDILSLFSIKYLPIILPETNNIFICKVLKLLVVSTPEQFELNLKYSCSHSGTISHKPVYTSSIETRRYKSKIKIGIRLRSCTNLSGRKKDSALSEITLRVQ